MVKGDVAGFLNAALQREHTQRVLTAGVEHTARAVLVLDCVDTAPPAASEWHAQESSAALRATAAATWFLATDECTRQALTCLPGGDTALDKSTIPSSRP